MPSILKISRKTNGGLEELNLPGGSVTITELASPADNRDEVIAANEEIVVPGYVVGSGQLQVFLDGVLCMCGTDADACVYAEVGNAGDTSGSIVFHQSIPVDLEILVRVSV